jgi:hypothetical protein
MAEIIEGSSYLKDKKLQYKNESWVYLILLFVGLSFFWIGTLYFRFSVIPTIFSTSIFLVLFFVIRNSLHFSIPLVYRYKHGEQGETWIRDELRKLSDTYTVISDVHIAGKKSNIDFVVVGPTGVFSIEVKNATYEVTYDGHVLIENGFMMQEHDIIRQVRDEYWSVHEYIVTTLHQDIFVTPIVAFPNKCLISRLPKQIHEIHFVRQCKLVSFIQNVLPHTLPLDASTTALIVNILNDQSNHYS